MSLNTLRTYWSRIREKVGDVPRTALVAAFVAEELGNAAALMPDPLQHEGWVMDAETRMLLATDTINDDHGLERGVPHPALEYALMTHPEDFDELRDSVFAVADGKIGSVLLVFRVVTARGVLLVNSSVHGIKNEQGIVKKVFGFRVKSLDCRPGRNPLVRVGHWEEEDYESEYFTVDDEMARILGSSVSGRISRSETMTWKRHPEDEAVARKACEDAVAARQEHLVTDVRLVLGDGSMVWGRAKRRFEYQHDGKVRIYGTFSVFE